MKLSHKLIMVSAAALMGISPVLSSTPNVANAATAKSSKKTTAKKTASTKKSSNSITLTHNAYVYDENGKRLSKYMGSAKYTTIAKGVTVKSSGTKTINGKKYYSLGNGAYIKAANVDGSSKSSSSKKTTSTVETTSITLTHNAYFYNQKGKRIKKYNGMSKLAKGSTVDSYGTKKIKGKKYYQLNAKGTVFIKAGNVDKKAKSSSKTTITLKKNAYIYDGNGDTNKKGYKKGKKLTATEARYIGTKLYYKIGDDQYIKAANVGKVSGPELEPVNEPDGAATVDGADNVQSDITVVTTKTITPLYDIKGKADTAREFGAGQRQQVSELRYIATSATSTPELFYKLASGRGYLKASDVTVSGKNMGVINTPEQAKAEVTVATAADKAKLTQSISEATSVKASEAYKLSDATLRAAYDKAVTDGTTVNNSSTSTVAQVNEAQSSIADAKAKLDGKKVTVANMSALTTDEVNAIIKLAASVNNVPESSIQFSNNNTTLSIVTNGYQQALNINDYASQN